MPLSVIGAGLGRTGTDSMKHALEILGCGPCYHMYEVIPHQDRIDMWTSFADGVQPDWDFVFRNYHATVDWPAAYYWRELAAHFPAAKIILSVRSPESWFESMSNTILRIVQTSAEPNGMRTKLFIPVFFEGNVHDKDHILSIYNRHNEAVIKAIPQDRLLVYELGSGWGPICEFLGVDIPDVPYPMGNSTAEFSEKLDRVTASRGTP